MSHPPRYRPKPWRMSGLFVLFSANTSVLTGPSLVRPRPLCSCRTQDSILPRPQTLFSCTNYHVITNRNQNLENSLPKIKNKFIVTKCFSISRIIYAMQKHLFFYHKKHNCKGVIIYCPNKCKNDSTQNTGLV
ncbi:unnamed protein product [Ilex paraguariensis]|uniref:Secreted protein n=1 Tax=Ilex paraguariensis TaxID=185542 RepID=A0ABC8SC89_9AQUA